ncbi:alpha-methylacyl-CoA racemase [Rhodococcus erythropolis]|uniref:CaiB/BaiF CoA transferase family protein n=1 Tax=Rhodococcus erythropolis TaxID=1833 RepID=UPI0021685890|nr:CaiB/BaiF CoA-transferase family protein [Rhodococcus erythropolis]MCS4255995.1 alpha-methylacyl-CoA racemase [Rhodococcus erythropolis]MCW2425511.1 alpha-methylacyl-CoA racemase [Rhodococcus erythropolis]
MTAHTTRSGPLTSLRVIEFAGIGPGPFAAMMLADMGADVIRIDRADSGKTQETDGPHPDLLNRGRRSIALDLKSDAGRNMANRLVDSADIVIEGFRPGVMERLGLGPDECLKRNPELIYGRMTGWGQTGPQAQFAGHDIDYIAITGALHGFGRKGEPPVPPLNLVGDFAGGAMMLAFGLLAAALEVRHSGKGQVIDAAMVDGTALLTTAIHALRNRGIWTDERGVNLLDTGAPFYEVYECADGKYVAVGAIEPKFYRLLTELVGLGESSLGPDSVQDQMDSSHWPERKELWAKAFLAKTRDQWCEIAERSDACLAPVLDWNEAPHHPHLQYRQTFVEDAGVTQPAPAPRFSRTPGRIQRPAPHPGEHTSEIVTEFGLTAPVVP